MTQSSFEYFGQRGILAPFEKGGDKTRQRLVGDLLFAPRANPPSPASRPPAPFLKGGYSGCSQSLLTGALT